MCSLCSRTTDPSATVHLSFLHLQSERALRWGSTERFSDQFGLKLLMRSYQKPVSWSRIYLVHVAHSGRIRETTKLVPQRWCPFGLTSWFGCRPTFSVYFALKSFAFFRARQPLFSWRRSRFAFSAQVLCDVELSDSTACGMPSALVLSWRRRLVSVIVQAR